MVTPTRAADALTRLTRLIANDSAGTNAALFARLVLEEWSLSDMAEEATEGVAELVDWTLRHSESAYLEIQLRWDGPLLFTEVIDHDDRLPNVPITLRSPYLDCGAEHTDRGRCIWTSYRTGRVEQLETAA